MLVLRASTGKRVWHFQATHHDVYDADVNSPPSLFETTIDGQRVLGVAQLTKMAYLFLFNRLTGEPLFGVEERPVPWFDAPGDEAWPTQPFPVKPAGLARNSMTRAEVSKISPEAEKYCTEVFDKTVNVGPYTPYGMVPNLVFPGSEGGGGWGGVATNSPMDLVMSTESDHAHGGRQREGHHDRANRPHWVMIRLTCPQVARGIPRRPAEHSRAARSQPA